MKRSSFSGQQIAFPLQQARQATQGTMNTLEIATISYVQSQVPKVSRYPVRIQTSLLFVVPLSGRTASN